jgi:hypothetical protein
MGLYNLPDCRLVVLVTVRGDGITRMLVISKFSDARMMSFNIKENIPVNIIKTVKKMQ